MDQGDVLSELESSYQEAVDADRDIVAEMRSHVLLFSGEHYNNKKFKKAFDNLRLSKDVPEEQRIRITKNHVKKIVKLYVNNILSIAPGTCIEAAQESELKDQKAAELHQAVWKYLVDYHKISEDKIVSWAFDFITFGELYVRVGWDWLKGYKLATNDVTKEHEWSGAITYDRIFAPDIQRPAGCKSLADAPWWGEHEMVPQKELKAQYASDPKKLKAVEPSSDKTFHVFDYNKSDYASRKDMVLIKKRFYKPCAEYPDGYFYFWTSGGILEESPLPGGLWPYAMAGFDEVPTHPRFRGLIKDIKPFQLELNRMASKIVEHHITMGDDKIIVANGAKMSPAGNSPGIRAYSVSGPAPTVLPGRTGDQFLGQVDKTVAEMYAVAMVSEELDEKPTTMVDPYAMLLQSAKWKKKFMIPIMKFQSFYKDITRLSLEYTRLYGSEADIYKMVGNNERCNVQEFKNADPLCYQIKIVEQTDDIESRLGKKLSIDRYIQYAGNNMDKQDIGKFIRLDPYLNKELLMKDLTLDYDAATNMILALDRGDKPQVFKNDNAKYMLDRLVSRTRSADFRFLHPFIQQMYDQYIQIYEKVEADQVQQAQALKDGFIPSQAMLVTCDFYQPDPKDPTRQVRVRLPYDSLQWLISRLDQQGQTQQMLATQQSSTVSDLAKMLGSQQQQQMQGPPAQGPMAQGPMAQGPQAPAQFIPGQG